MGGLGRGYRACGTFSYLLPPGPSVEEILEQLGSRWNIPIRQIDPEFAEKLTPGVLRILIQMHFNLSQCRLVGNSVSENAIQDSPVAMALADDLAEILCSICGESKSMNTVYNYLQ